MKLFINIFIFGISNYSSPNACFCVLVKHLVEIKLKLVVKLFYANDKVEINLLCTLFAVSVDTFLISV